jgi:Ca2+-binding RTX toxin-like protein
MKKFSGNRPIETVKSMHSTIEKIAMASGFFVLDVLDSDTENGDGANDKLDGGESDDALYGSAGNDILSGGEGDDTLDGGDSFDFLKGDGGNDILKGGTGNNSMDGGADNDVITGGDDYDIINGGEGADVIEAGGGADLITGGAGAVYMKGGAGDDQYIYDSASFGTDLIEDSTGTLAGVIGGSYDTNALAYVGGGYEYRKYSMGTMILLGINRQGDASNTIYIKNWQAGQFGISLSGQEEQAERPQSSPAQVTSRAGNDVDFIINNDAADGGQGNDIVVGTDSQSVLAGGASNDILDGRGCTRPTTPHQPHRAKAASRCRHTSSRRYPPRQAHRAGVPAKPGSQGGARGGE